MTLTDEQLKEGTRLYAAVDAAWAGYNEVPSHEASVEHDCAVCSWNEWLDTYGSALFAMAARAARYDAAVREHLSFGAPLTDADLGADIRRVYAERDRAEQREPSDANFVPPHASSKVNVTWGEPREGGVLPCSEEE